jgi:hypothetical protein
VEYIGCLGCFLGTFEINYQRKQVVDTNGVVNIINWHSRGQYFMEILWVTKGGSQMAFDPIFNFQALSGSMS